jgi:hypothetical protein
MAAFSADLLLSRLLARPLKMPVLATQAALLARLLESGTLLGTTGSALLGNSAETLLSNAAVTLLGNAVETLLSGPLDWSGRKDLAGRDDKQTQYRHNRYISHVHLLVRRLKVAGTCPNTRRFLFYSTVQVCPASRF